MLNREEKNRLRELAAALGVDPSTWVRLFVAEKHAERFGQSATK